MNLEGKYLGNRYEILEKIGNGGMATVYKARCHVLNRYVAVKVLRDEFTTDEEFIKRFNSEAQSAASLTHPNIVSVYDVGIEDNIYYIVMELIQGKTLKEIISTDGALSWKWSINVGIQIASALETAHKNNIIHRDIKPHNIIITEEGVAKVTDFGIAKAVSNSTITAFGSTIGSVHYFSPEHARGGYTDAKSDLYSLGVVLYEMVTGRVPFDADTPVSVALKHMQETPIEPIKINPAVPSAVNDIIMKAMQKDVNLRYANATEMLRDLSMALKKPDGNFVIMNSFENGDFPTQRIPILNNMDIEEQIKEKDKEINSRSNKKKKQSKLKQYIEKHKVLSVILGIIILFSLTVGITYLATSLGRVGDVQVPNLVGLSTEEAEKQLKDLKLKYEVSEEKFDLEVPAGYIISQDPAYIPNYKIKEKTTIKVVVSKGQEEVTIPKVAGMKKEEAIEELEKLNLKFEIKEEISTKVEEDYVIKQSPDANTVLKAGETITITVSIGDGIEKTTVPSVIGKSESDARKILEAASLSVNVIYEESSNNANGTVLKQDISAGTETPTNSTINITVNKVEETKNATVTINVKSITEGYTDDPVKAKVEVSVSGGGSGFTKSGVDKNSTSVTGNITGKGNVTITVKITDENGDTDSTTKTINLNDITSVSIP